MKVAGMKTKFRISRWTLRCERSPVHPFLASTQLNQLTGAEIPMAFRLDFSPPAFALRAGMIGSKADATWHALSSAC
jgi:hypothetical protein